MNSFFVSAYHDDCTSIPHILSNYSLIYKMIMFTIASLLGKHCEIQVRYHFPQSDVFRAKLVFHFNSNQGSEAFRIPCLIEVSYISTLVEKLAITGKYKIKKPINIRDIKRSRRFRYDTRLGSFCFEKQHTRQCPN